MDVFFRKITGKILCLNYSIEHCYLTRFVSLSSTIYTSLEVCYCLKLMITLFSTRDKPTFLYLEISHLHSAMT